MNEKKRYQKHRGCDKYVFGFWGFTSSRLRDFIYWPRRGLFPDLGFTGPDLDMDSLLPILCTLDIYYMSPLLGARARVKGGGGDKFCFCFFSVCIMMGVGFKKKKNE